MSTAVLTPPKGGPPPLPGAPALLTAPPPPGGVPAYGTQIQVLSSAVGVTPEVYATIAGVGDITGPNPQVAEVDTTSHSTGSPHRTFIPTLIDDGQISFKLFWQPGDPTHDAPSPYSLEALFESRQVTKWQIVNTDAGHRTRQGWGYVKQLSETYPVAGMCEKAVIIRSSGGFTVVASTMTVVPASASPAAAGGAATFTVHTGGNAAAWMPVAQASWLHITAPTAPTNNDGPVNYTVDVNAVGSAARTGLITIPAFGLVFQVNQAAG